LATLLLGSVTRGQDPVVIEARESWTNVFAGGKLTCHYAIKHAASFQGRVVWAYTDAGQRVLPRGRGEAPLPAGSALAVALELPPLKPGVVLKTRLTLRVVDRQDRAVAEHVKTIWVFAPDPFIGRTQWLRDLKITLYDPDPDRKTAAVLQALAVPFEEQRNLAALAALPGGLLLIGEGVSFTQETGLAEVLRRRARRGQPILCLAPREGSFPLIDTGADELLPKHLVFRGREVINQLDARLDAASWAPNSPIVLSALLPRTMDQTLTATVADKARGWPWLEFAYPQAKGPCVLCGFAVVKNWHASPTPRYLLLRLLEFVAETGKPPRDPTKGDGP
jgi:hypothetical protein